MNNTRVEHFILELTRRCNMNCKHCLRGKSEDMEMSFDIAQKALNSFSQIGSITFSGGEPTLCENLISDIVDYIINNNIDVHGFYMASNGKNINMNVMFSLARLYAYIYKNEGGYLDDYQCVFDVSVDQFHEEIGRDNLGILKAFSFVSQRGEINPSGVIDEGNAMENHIGCRKLNHKKDFYISEEDEEYGNLYELVYVNSKGNIYADCDFSYASQDQISHISILQDKSFDELAKEYAQAL